jgi:hypothetical protein
MTAFRQCAASKPDGKRCRRVALSNSDFCYAHRRSQPLDLSHMQHFVDLGIYLTPNRTVPACDECHDLIGGS